MNLFKYASLDAPDCKLVLSPGSSHLYWDAPHDVNILMEKTSVLKKFPFHFIYLIVNIAFKEKGPKIFSYAIDASRHPYLLRSKYRKIIRKGIFKSISIYLVPCCPRYKIIQSVYHGKCWSISKYINFLNNTGDIFRKLQ